MSEQNSNKLVIKGQVEADNTVIGEQVTGGDAQGAATIKATPSNVNSTVEVDTEAKLRTNSLVVGFQFITDAEAPTSDQIKSELAAIRSKLDELLEVGSLKNEGDGEDASDAMRKADEAMQQNNPKRSVVKLEEVSKALSNLTEIVGKASELGLKLASFGGLIAGLIQVCTKTFGLG